MLAAAAVGVHESIESASKAMSGTGLSYQPRPQASAIYDRLYAVYRDIYSTNRELFARLAEATR